LRSLVSALRECKRQRGDVVLVSPSERVLEVLRLAGLDTLFEIYDNSTEAVGNF
jgi:anti-sigma B factor antagonist